MIYLGKQPLSKKRNNLNRNKPMKEPTAKQLAARKAFGEAAKARAQAKKDKEATTAPEPVQANNDNADIGELLARIKELESRIKTPEAPLSTPQVGAQGLTGTHEKYRVSPKYYPDPRERLSLEQRLQRFAFNDNYELDFNVGLSTYKTIDGINTREPKFTLKLVRVVYDEDNGEATDQRYVASTLIFHEDPDTALSIAQDNGVDVESMGEKEFLDEMRYMRMRDWLIECFYPPAPVKAQDSKEVVIGNRLVEVYTVSSETPQAIPFGTLSKKL